MLIKEKPFIRLIGIEEENMAFYTIKLDDEQELTLTLPELKQLKQIFDESYDGMLEFANKIEKGE